MIVDDPKVTKETHKIIDGILYGSHGEYNN